MWNIPTFYRFCIENKPTHIVRTSPYGLYRECPPPGHSTHDKLFSTQRNRFPHEHTNTNEHIFTQNIKNKSKNRELNKKSIKKWRIDKQGRDLYIVRIPRYQCCSSVTKSCTFKSGTSHPTISYKRNLFLTFLVKKGEPKFLTKVEYKFLIKNEPKSFL